MTVVIMSAGHAGGGGGTRHGGAVMCYENLMSICSLYALHVHFYNKKMLL